MVTHACIEESVLQLTSCLHFTILFVFSACCMFLLLFPAESEKDRADSLFAFCKNYLGYFYSENHTVKVYFLPN